MCSRWQLLTDGVDYNFTSIVGNISKEITLVVPIIIGLNIAAIKMGTQIAQFPNPDSVAAALIDIIPAGIIMPFGGSSAPVGWLLCDGASLSTTAYPKLYAAIQTNFGSAGAGFFNAPNTRGVFLRGAGSQTISGITYTGTLGIAANDKFQGHYHNTYGAGSGSRWGAGSTDGSTGDNNYPIYEAITDGTNGTPRTGAETVPANLSVNYIIKC